MAEIISLINLKGGVGKTTLTIGLADFLAEKHGKKVLVVDLDPQTNATVSLITQEEWRKVNKENNTIHQLFLDKIKGTSAFEIRRSRIKAVGNLKNAYNNIDLLPSSIDLIDILEDITILKNGKEKLAILEKELKQIEKDYDYILIDCPPDLSSITMTGLYASQKYIIPVIPDTLSTYGLNQLIKKIEDKVRDIKRIKKNYNCIPIGIVINRYTGSIAQKNIKLGLEAQSGKELPKVFKTYIRALDKIGSISEETQNKITIKEKYKNSYEDLEKLAEEFIKEV